MRLVNSGDAQALLALWNRSVEFDPLTPELLHEKLYDDPGPALVWEEDGLQAFGHAVERNDIGYIKLLCVAPEARRRGLGRQLVQQLEQKLAAPLLRVAGSAPNYLQPGIDVRYTPGLLLFEQLGYQRFGDTLNLRCPVQQGSYPPGVRRATAEDRQRLLLFIDEHFPAWRAEVTACFNNQPISCFVAERDRQLVGFSAYDANNRGAGWFGPMGTAAQARGGGLGARLLHCCLQAFREQGLTSCVIPWVGPYGFYARHAGAWIERVFWRYEKRRA